MHAASGKPREVNEATAARRAEQAARTALSDEVLALLKGLGSALRHEDVAALAFGVEDAG